MFNHNSEQTRGALTANSISTTSLLHCHWKEDSLYPPISFGIPWMKRNSGRTKYTVKVPEDERLTTLGPTPIVIDSGSQYTKIGDAGNEFPRYVIPSVVATLRANKSTHKAGFDALRYIGQNSTKWRLDRAFDPMEPDWDCALALWEHAFLVSVYSVGSKLI